MKPLRRLNDNPDDLRKRISALPLRSMLRNYLERRLIVAVARCIRHEVRQERKAAG